jgi:hypothetical protein
MGQIHVEGLDTESRLPMGWVAEFNEEEKKYYYMNSLTKSKQTEYPTSPAAFVPEISLSLDNVTVHVDTTRSKASSNDEAKIHTTIHEENKDNHIVTDIDDEVLPPSYEDIEESDEEYESRESTSSYESEEETVQKIYKKGLLMKQSGFFCVYKQKYFILENNILEYYESIENYMTQWGKEPKEMEITAFSEVGYRDLSVCFYVKTGEKKWILLAANKRDLEDWISCITEVIRIEKKKLNL